MTDTQSPSIDFLARLRKIDNAEMRPRDILVLWAIARQPGMMGMEMSTQLGYRSRSQVQLSIGRLIKAKFIEDRRPVFNRQTPNSLYSLPAGDAFLAEIVPA